MIDAPPDLGSLRGRRLWISGGRGFIGARTVQLAEQAGALVHVFGGDVTDEDAVAASLVEPFDCVLHLAAPVDVRRDPALRPTMQRVIVGGTRNVLRHAGGARFIQVGTCEEYGAIEAPFAEDDEPGPPVSPYAEAKLDATRLVLAAAPARALVVRPFLTYGPGQRARQLVPAAIDAALARRPFPMTAGLQTRELNHVDDIAVGLLRAAAADLCGTVVNIGCGQDHRVIDLVRRIFTLADAPTELVQAGAMPTRTGEVPRFFAAVERARELLGHVASIPLDDGLLETIEAAR